MEDSRRQSLAEERVNAWTHGVGAALGLAGLVATGVSAVLPATDALVSISLAAYTLSVLVLFGLSTAYHAMPDGRVKRALQKGDHCAIYGLIAGTYTPFCLLALGGTGGWVMFGALWVLAITGVALELVVAARGGVRFEKTALVLYLAMGWSGLLAAAPFIRALPWAALGLVVFGGVLYTAGTWFYTRDRPWDHAIWHGFVLGGAAAHGGAVVALLG